MVSEERLLAEAAVLAERRDVDEEVVRLRTHVESFLAMLDEGGELGKRLDFLAAGAESGGEYAAVEDQRCDGKQWIADDGAGAWR